MAARALATALAQTTAGAVRATTAVLAFEADEVTPFASNLYAARSGGSPLPSLQTDSEGILKVFTAATDARPISFKIAADPNQHLGDFQYDSRDVALLDTAQTLTNKIVRVVDGLVGTPGLRIGNDTTGIYAPAAGKMGFATTGVEIARLTSTGLRVGTAGDAETVLHVADPYAGFAGAANTVPRAATFTSVGAITLSDICWNNPGASAHGGLAEPLWGGDVVAIDIPAVATGVSAPGAMARISFAQTAGVKHAVANYIHGKMKGDISTGGLWGTNSVMDDLNWIAASGTSGIFGYENDLNLDNADSVGWWFDAVGAGQTAGYTTTPGEGTDNGGARQRYTRAYSARSMGVGGAVKFNYGCYLDHGSSVVGIHLGTQKLAGNNTTGSQIIKAISVDSGASARASYILASPDGHWLARAGSGHFLVQAVTDDQTAAGTTYVDLGPTGIFVNDSANANMTFGATLNQGAADNEILALKSSDVAHGVTTLTETDTYGRFSKLGGTTGALVIDGLCDSGAVGVYLRGVAVTADTGKTASSIGVVAIDGSLKNGTGLGAVGPNGNLLTVHEAAGGAASGCKFIVDSEGNILSDDTASVYDGYDDIALCRALDYATNPAAVIANEFDRFLRHGADDLVRASILHPAEKPGGKPFISWTRLAKLHNGAIGQLAVRLQRLEALALRPGQQEHA